MSGPGPSVRDHLANERTLLAWIRTAVTVIGLGFLLDCLAPGPYRSNVALHLGMVGVVAVGAALVAIYLLSS
jgi:putative membrane protein